MSYGEYRTFGGRSGFWIELIEMEMRLGMSGHFAEGEREVDLRVVWL